jgi:hypothetical protein
MALHSDTIGTTLRQVFAYETLTVDTVSTALTAATYAPPASYQSMGKVQRATIQANDQPARFRVDGGTPTATVGHKLAAGESVIITGLVNISNFRIIKEGATAVNVAVSYER